MQYDYIEDGTYVVVRGTMFAVNKVHNYGYWVGCGILGTTIELTDDQLNDQDALRNAIVETSNRKGAEEFDFVGVWTDPKTGTVYVDPVIGEAIDGTARENARTWGEKAIYDIAKQESVYV